MVEEAFSRAPVVLVVGPRGAGKRELLRRFAWRTGAGFLDLDEPGARATLEQSPRWARDYGAIAEVTRVPAALSAVRREVRRSPGSRRFLLSASALNPGFPTQVEAFGDLLRVVRLWPLSQGEIERRREGFLEGAFSARQPRPVWPAVGEVWERVSRGGFPEAVGLSPGERGRWFRGYLEWLVPELERRGPGPWTARVLDLLALIAERSGGFFSPGAATRVLATGGGSAYGYLDRLRKSFLVYRLDHWGPDPGEAPRHRPRYHLVDSGLAFFLAGQRRRENLLRSFVVLELLKQASWYREELRLGYFRPARGGLVDLVLEGRDGVVAVSVWPEPGPPPRSAWAGLAALEGELGERFLGGYLVHLGTRARELGGRVWALPLSAVWG